MKAALNKAGRLVGSMSALAMVLGITKGAVSQWECAPADRVLDIARATKWGVTPHELRPDIYPNHSDGVPLDFDDCTESEGGEA
jgi:DNA-binding transcriptional regulator YdaS (Cro superfamily)